MWQIQRDSLSKSPLTHISHDLRFMKDRFTTPIIQNNFMYISHDLIFMKDRFTMPIIQNNFSFLSSKMEIGAWMLLHKTGACSLNLVAVWTIPPSHGLSFLWRSTDFVVITLYTAYLSPVVSPLPCGPHPFYNLYSFYLYLHCLKKKLLPYPPRTFVSLYNQLILNLILYGWFVNILVPFESCDLLGYSAACREIRDTQDESMFYKRLGGLTSGGYVSFFYLMGSFLGLCQFSIFEIWVLLKVVRDQLGNFFKKSFIWVFMILTEFDTVSVYEW